MKRQLLIVAALFYAGIASAQLQLPVIPPPAPKGWHLEEANYGIDLYRALDYLKDRKPTRVKVAILDSGFEITHPNLKSVVWVNPKEIAGDNIDNDGNGYIDDLHGWNFLGASDGQMINNTAAEAEREFLRLYAKLNDVDTSKLNKKERKEYLYYRNEVIPTSSLGKTYLASLSNVERSKKTFLSLKKAIETLIAQREEKVQTVKGAMYGNNNLMSRNLNHGTHVAGIIAGTEAEGFRGVCPNAELLLCRVVPEGDEYDDDVAHAIRYAVDNGAQIINMSFGKVLSANPKMVYDALRYAEKKGVFVVIASGNDGWCVDDSPLYPHPKGGKAKNLVHVGATDCNGMPAFFTNFGKKNVDIFSPGVDIYSTYRTGTFSYMNGTSMAAPVVSGVAALLKSYFPKLTAAQIKMILCESSKKQPERMVTYPQKDKTKNYPKEGLFSEMSISGGIVNVYEAIKMADELMEK